MIPARKRYANRKTTRGSKSYKDKCWVVCLTAPHRSPASCKVCAASAVVSRPSCQTSQVNTVQVGDGVVFGRRVTVGGHDIRLVVVSKVLREVEVDEIESGHCALPLHPPAAKGSAELFGSVLLRDINSLL